MQSPNPPPLFLKCDSETDERTLNSDFVNALSSELVDLASCKFEMADLSVFYFNIRGLRSKLDELISVLDNIAVTPDVLVLTETWLTKDIKKLYSIPGYNHFGVCRDEKRGGGISIYISNQIDFILVEEGTIIIENYEILHTLIRLNRAEIRIIAIYRPPSGNLECFMKHLNTLLNKHKNKNLFIGDFNINLRNIISSVASYIYLAT